MRGVASPLLGRGMHACARVVAALRDQPMSTAELAEHFKATGHTARTITRDLIDLGVICIVEKRRISKKGRLTSILGLGESPPLPPRRCSPSSEAVKFASVWHALKKEKMGVADLRAHTGLGQRTLYLLLRLMRKLNIARISEWECGPGERVALWRLGKSDNAPKPKPIPHAQLVAEYQRRRRERNPGHRRVRQLSANASIFTLAKAMRNAA